jgi:hypothetical protein
MTSLTIPNIRHEALGPAPRGVLHEHRKRQNGTTKRSFTNTLGGRAELYPRARKEQSQFSKNIDE